MMMIAAMSTAIRSVSGNRWCSSVAGKEVGRVMDHRGTGNWGVLEAGEGHLKRR